MCSLRCRFRSWILLNFDEHVSQTNFFSCEWMSKWDFRLWCLVNVCGQWGHKNFLGSGVVLWLLLLLLVTEPGLELLLLLLLLLLRTVDVFVSVFSLLISVVFEKAEESLGLWDIEDVIESEFFSTEAEGCNEEDEEDKSLEKDGAGAINTGVFIDFFDIIIGVCCWDSKEEEISIGIKKMKK